MVRLSDTQVNVVESRRTEGWGLRGRLVAGQYGLFVFVIDAIQDIDLPNEESWDGVSIYQTLASVRHLSFRVSFWLATDSPR